MKAKSITKKKKEKSNTTTYHHPDRLSRGAASYVARKLYSKYARSRRGEDEGQGNEFLN